MGRAAVRGNPDPPGAGAVTDAVIAEMVATLVEEADPEQVILFGSRGRGDARTDSDVDLIVVEEEALRPRAGPRSRKWRGSTGRLRRIRDSGRHPCVLASEDVEYWRDSLNHVLARALREGKVVYERR